jgi:aminopeptidase
MSAEELARYARLVVDGCVAIGGGDSVVVRAEPEHRELVVALARAAYEAGAVSVAVVSVDPRLEAARIELGGDDALGHVTPWESARARASGRRDVATIAITGTTEPEVTASLDPARVAVDQRMRRDRTRALDRARAEFRFRNTICAWPTVAWSRLVYPELDDAGAQRALARDLLWFCRIGDDDPAGHTGWSDLLTRLRARARRLTELDLVRLEVRDRGTSLSFGIAEHSLWRGGGETDHWGRQIAMNLPTEENFLSPHAAATEGTFTCSRPRFVGGRLIDGLRGEFRSGRLVRLEAASEDDRDWLASYLAASPGGDRCGEIALVDTSSRVGAARRTYFNALVDENAVAHLAFGAGYTKTRSLPVGRRRYGLNRSSVHVDVMIGTEELEAVGVTRSGARVTLIADGRWGPEAP